MANYLAQFQTIKNSLDHLVIAGKSHNSYNPIQFFGIFFSNSKFELHFLHFRDC